MNTLDGWLAVHVLPSLYLNDVISNIVNGINHVRGGALLGLLAFGGLIFVVGGYFYSGGDDGKRKAKAIWIGSGIAVAVGVVAVAIVNYIKGAMGGGF